MLHLISNSNILNKKSHCLFNFPIFLIHLSEESHISVPAFKILHSLVLYWYPFLIFIDLNSSQAMCAFLIWTLWRRINCCSWTKFLSQTAVAIVYRLHDSQMSYNFITHLYQMQKNNINNKFFFNIMMFSWFDLFLVKIVKR